MSLTRDQLVSEWRSRLAELEGSPAGVALRPAWLVRVQRRLYRFLLSLYGDGDWRTTDTADSSPIEIVGVQSVIFDSPDVLPLSGKPAKASGKIREVLKAVATAQEQALAAGPLVAGLPADYWKTVAVHNRAVDPSRCVKLLRSRQFTTRVISRDGGLAVEVPAAEHRAALKLLLAHERRGNFSQPVPSSPLSTAAFWILTGVLFAPIPAFAALLVTNARYPDGLAGKHSAEAALYALALFLAFTSIACVRPISRLVLAADRLVMHWAANLKKRLFTKR